MKCRIPQQQLRNLQDCSLPGKRVEICHVRYCGVAVGSSDRSFNHGSVGETALLQNMRQCVAGRILRCSASPKHRAHFEVVHCRLRENALDAKATVVRVRHADVSREGEKRGPCSLVEPFDQPHAFCVYVE